MLDRPEYAEHWANKWADLLRPNPYRVGIKAVLNYDAWIRDQFRRNVPWDQFVRELLTPRGARFTTERSAVSRSTITGRADNDHDTIVPGHSSGMRQVPSSSI
ncbi:MAG: DUF1549 domain-containing protein [Pirellulaceae bacterium]